MKVKIPAVPEDSYNISIAAGILNTVLESVQADFPNNSCFVVTDKNLVSAGHLKTLLGDSKIPSYVIDPPGEISKNIDTVVAIIEAMEKASLGRDTVVIALGGGTVGDIAGFVAAIFKRGIPVVQIPTTPVSQADSGVGGKTGVDSSLSKNAFGVFWQPAAVYLDVATLTTLDDRQFRAGLVESVKHALIADSEYFDFLEKNLELILERKLDVLEKVAEYNCRIKGDVVAVDPTEKNQRRMLNYGHTIGHAVESVSGFELLHGEAISIGLIAAGLIEKELGISEPGRFERIKTILEKMGLPTALPKNLDKDKVLEAIKRDKKALNKWPKFVVIEKIGKVHCIDGQWAIDVEQQIIEKVLNNFYILVKG